MKTETQASENVKLKQSSAPKVQLPKTNKAPRKKAKSAKSNPKRARNSASVQGTGEKGFIARGKEALEQFPQWANRAASALPKNVRNLELPHSAPLQDYFREKPLILGAVGLGLGAILGAMLPAHRSAPSPRRKK